MRRLLLLGRGLRNLTSNSNAGTGGGGNRKEDKVNPLLLAPLVFSALAVSSVIAYSLLPEPESELERFASGLPSSSRRSSPPLVRSASANTIRAESRHHLHPPRITVGEKVDREQLQARYVIDTSANKKIAVIGKGAYGRVLSARQVGGESKVAMKVVSPGQMSARALSMEVDVLKRVRGHDNIIHLLEVLECQNEWYLVTELCEGGDLLDRLISYGRYEEDKCAAVLFNVASGLHHVHQCGYVHLDLKPENLVFVSKQVRGDDVRIVDFGMSKDLYSIEKAGGLALRSGQGNPVTGELPPRVGTVAYWSPEQILAGNAINDKSVAAGGGERLVTSDPTKIDVWGLGVIAYIMLFGCHPFDVKGEGNEWQICRNVLSKPPDFEYGGVVVSPECKSLLAGLLEPDPAKRLSLEEAMAHPFFRAQQQREEVSKLDKVVRIPNSWKAAGYALERTKEDEVIDSCLPRIAPFKTIQASQAIVQALLLAAVACADEEDESFQTPKHLFRAAFNAMDAKHEGVITLESLNSFIQVLKRNTGEADHMLQAMERAAGRLSFQPIRRPSNGEEEAFVTFEEFVALLRALSCVPRSFNRDEVLFEQGSVPQGVYLLVKGQARVESRRDKDGTEVSPKQIKQVEEGFATIPSGSIIGETAIVQGRTERSATIRITKDESQVIYIPKQEFLLALASSKVLQEKLFALTNEQQAKRVFQLFDRLQENKETLTFGAGQQIFKQGEAADSLYLVKRGTVELTVEGQANFNQANERMHVRVGTRQQGDVIGVSAMNPNAKRGTSATCSTQVEVDKISSVDLIQHMHDYPLLRFFMDSQKRWRNENWQQRLAEVERGISEPHILPVLGEGVEEDQGKTFELYRAELANAPVKEFAKGEYVFRHGDRAGEMFVLESGRCDVELSNKQGKVLTITTLGPGDHIGEQSLLDRAMDYSFSMKCLSPVRIRVLGPAQLQRLMSRPPFQRTATLLMHQRRHRWVSNLLALAHECGVSTEFIALNQGDTLFEVGDPITRLCKVLRGTIVITNPSGEVVRVLNPGDTVGWEVFRKDDTLVTSQMRATCQTKCFVEAITVDTIEALVENNRYVSKELEMMRDNAAPEFSSAKAMIKRNSSKLV